MLQKGEHRTVVIGQMKGIKIMLFQRDPSISESCPALIPVSAANALLLYIFGNGEEESSVIGAACFWMQRIRTFDDGDGSFRNVNRLHQLIQMTAVGAVTCMSLLKQWMKHLFAETFNVCIAAGLCKAFGGFHGMGHVKVIHVNNRRMTQYERKTFAEGSLSAGAWTVNGNEKTLLLLLFLCNDLQSRQQLCSFLADHSIGRSISGSVLLRMRRKEMLIP